MDFGDPVERFHKKYAVNAATGCWEWSCYRHPDGYGIMAIGKKLKVRAHRFAYERFVGPIPDGMQVCHTCDLPRCTNPAHLFLGTAKDNAQDKSRKGRSGDTSAKMTEAKVWNLRVMYARGMSLVDLAAIYGIRDTHAASIVKGRSWQ